MGHTFSSLHGSQRLSLAPTSRATAPDTSPCSPPVQHECIPQAILGMDILCQAKSGMGKTAVFVLATLQQIEPVNGQVETSFPVTSYVGFSVLPTAHSPLCAWVPGDMKLLAPVCCLPLQRDCGEQSRVLGILGACSGRSLDVPRACR